MSINLWEVYTLLISVQREVGSQAHKKKWKKLKTFYAQLRVSKSKPSQEKRKSNMIMCEWVRERKGGNLDTHRALVISLRSFSASWKKRETTSTTKSGLLSSWSCWSCKNWSSRIPFSHQTKIKQKNQHIQKTKKKTKNKKKNSNNSPIRFRHNKNKTKPKENCLYTYNTFSWLYLHKQGLGVFNQPSLHLTNLHA